LRLEELVTMDCDPVYDAHQVWDLAFVLLGLQPMTVMATTQDLLGNIVAFLESIPGMHWRTLSMFASVAEEVHLCASLQERYVVEFEQLTRRWNTPEYTLEEAIADWRWQGHAFGYAPTAVTAFVDYIGYQRRTVTAEIEERANALLPVRSVDCAVHGVHTWSEIAPLLEKRYSRKNWLAELQRDIVWYQELRRCYPLLVERYHFVKPAHYKFLCERWWPHEVHRVYNVRAMLSQMGEVGYAKA